MNLSHPDAVVGATLAATLTPPSSPIPSAGSWRPVVTADAAGYAQRCCTGRPQRRPGPGCSGRSREAAVTAPDLPAPCAERLPS